MLKQHLLLFNEVSFVVNFYHGVYQAVRDLQVLQDVQHVHLLVHRLWMTDVSDVDQQVLVGGKKSDFNSRLSPEVTTNT